MINNNKRFNIAAIRQWFFGLLLLLSALTSEAQTEFPYPVAHYPLLVDRYRNAYGVQPWDVSGNGKHGNTWNAAANRFYDYNGNKGDHGLTSIPFLGKTYPALTEPQPNLPDIRSKNVLYKADSLTEDLHVDIPEPYTGVSSGSAYTICFWLYAIDVLDEQILIHVSGIDVKLRNKRIVLETAGNGNGEGHGSSQFLTMTKQWSFIAITRNSSGSFQFFWTTAPDQDFLYSLPAESVHRGFTINTPQIMHSSFKGGSICGVRFYTQNLSQSQLESVRLEDYNFAWNATAGDNHYLIRNMRSYYPFDKPSGQSMEYMRHNNVSRFGPNDATSISSGAMAYEDRYEEGSKALLLQNGRLNFNPFFANYLNDYNSETDHESICNNTQKGFTISFWIKLEAPVTSERGTILPPFDGNTPRNRLLCATNERGDIIWGLSRFNDRIAMRRLNYLTNNSSQYDAWDLWLYDPISFSEEGWYHIIYSQKANWFKLYMYQPNGEPVCQSVLWEIQEVLKNGTSNSYNWFLGKPFAETSNQDPLIIDDFRIYNWPMIPAELDALHQYETPQSSNFARSCHCSGEPSLIPEPVNTPELQNSVNLYPNPAKDQVTISVKTKEEGVLHYRLVDQQGKIHRTGMERMNKGQQTIRLTGLKLPNGIYYVQFNGAGIKKTIKLEILK